jgi:TP901 family phage tail tape measure protein
MLVSGVEKAGDLQGATLQAAIGSGRLGASLNATTANMTDMRQMAFRMSTMTGQSIADSMGVVAAMATAGVSPKQLKSIYKPVAQFTDILHFGKDKMDYGEAAKMGAGIVHDMRFFTPEDTAYGLGRIGQLAYLSPHGTQQIVTQIRRFAPTFENILPGTNRQKADTITDIAAWTDRMGNLPFAGSALSQMVTQMIAPRSERVAQSLVDLGVWRGHLGPAGKRGGKRHLVLDRNNFFDEHTGTFDVMAALHQVAFKYRDAKEKGPIVTALLQNTQNAARIMQALSSKEALTAYDRVVAQRRGMGRDPVAWMNLVQNQLMSQFSPTEQRAASNWQSLSTVIGDKLLPVLTPLVSRFADLLEVVTAFLDKHPRAAQAVAVGLAGTAVVGGAAALAMGGYIASGAFHWLTRHLQNPALGHAVAEAGHDALKVGGWRGVALTGAMIASGAGARLARTAFSLTGLGAFRSVPKFVADAVSAVRGLVGLGPAVLKTRGGWLLIGETLGKLGLRAIPVAGEVVMLLDAIKLLGKHSGDVGYGIGRAARWIHDNGATMLRDAIVAAFKAAVEMARGAAQGIPSVSPVKFGANGMPTSVDIPSLLGPGVSGLWHFGEGVVGGVRAGYNAGGPQVPVPAKPHLHAVPMASGGYVRGNGLAFLHKNEVVVNSRLTRGLERITAAHDRGGDALGKTVRIVLASEGGAGLDALPPHALRRLANAMLELVGHDVEVDSRAGGSIPSMSGNSHYGIMQGAPA